MDPITFHPLYMERIWGGRALEEVYERALPSAEAPYGEAWELVDRENEQSVVDHGPFSGKTLGELWAEMRAELFGERYENHGRFPVLLKILDSREDLSIQVHPPLSYAEISGGEPKTEMWFIADHKPGAKLYVGLKSGVSRADFEHAIQTGTVESLVHSIEPSRGESIFIASGRLHAIGAGLLIHEIQQNSDTTYRVYDWNRPGLDGNPRELHIEESLASIDFEDFEPGMDRADGETLACCEHFKTDKRELPPGSHFHASPEHFLIVIVTEGALRSASGRVFTKGTTLLLPRNGAPLAAEEASMILIITVP